MEFLQSNWFWIILAALFVWVPASGGSCCGHGKHRRSTSEDGQRDGH